MPTQRFSESTFAFAATHEISRLDPWWSKHVPILPSLRRERRGGYDVRFDLPGTVLLLQFKLSKELRQLQLRRKPRGVADLLRMARRDCRDGFWQFYTTDHQHRLLNRIAGRFEHVYYVAPRFSQLADLHGHYARRSILGNSIVAKLSEFPPVKKGASCKHRVISPHVAPRTYVFSTPVAFHPISLRSELQQVWEDWVSDAPLGAALEEIWAGLPPTGKTRALRWAEREVEGAGILPTVRYSQPVAREDPFLIAPPGADIAARRAPTPKRPPWPPHLFRAQRTAGLIKYDETDQVRLLALARIFELAGLAFSILQPSEKALENTGYYDEGT